ncbi:MAG TPA: hypothetical protein VME46_14670 [Acidimicrobiales bacterium]|nr:hypothetical protein [Acidimicrobiales bacterium]
MAVGEFISKAWPGGFPSRPFRGRERGGHDTVDKGGAPPASSAHPEPSCGEAVHAVDEGTCAAPLWPSGDLDEALDGVAGAQDPGNGH